MRAGVLLLVATTLVALAWTQFRDVPRQHWAYRAIRELAELGILEGFPDRTFQPERTMTRAEFAQAVARAYRVVEERIRALETRLAERTDETTQPTPEERQLQELRQALQELLQLRTAIENLQRLAQEFEPELRAQGENLRDLRRELAALETRLRREERRRQPLRTDLTLAVFGTHSYDKRSVYTLSGREINPSGKFLQSVSVLHELGLSLDVPVNDQVDAKATLIFGNYLPYTPDATRLADIVRSDKTTQRVGQTDFTVWEAYVSTPLELFGLPVQAQIGRVPLKLTPYTLQRIEPDHYLEFERYRDRAHRADGALLNFGQGTFTGQLFLVSSVGVRGNVGRFLPIYFANHNASVSAPADQMAGIRLAYQFDLTGYPVQVGATYFAAGVGRNRDFRHLNNTPRNGIDRVDVLGFDLQSTISEVEVRFEYAVSNLLRGDSRVVGSKNKAYDLYARYRFNERLDGQVGYREIDPYFVAPGNWGRIGYLYNPSDIKGTYLAVNYQATDALHLRLVADIYTGAARLPLAQGYQSRDRLRRFQLEANYRYAPRLQVGAIYENVGWDIARTGAFDFRRGKPEWNYLTLRATYDLSENSQVHLLYQYISTDGKGIALLSGGPSSTGNRAGVFATSLSYRF